MTAIEIGRLLRAGNTGCVLGCWVSQIDVPEFGGLVRIPIDDSFQIFGMIYDIHIDDDGLVRQLLSVGQLDEDVIQDNRENRNVPVEISTLFVGYDMDGQIFHLLPPRPPLILDAIYACTPDEICRFVDQGRLGYFRHLLRAADLPVSELLTAHIRQADMVQVAKGNNTWRHDAVQELMVLLRDDYDNLMGLLSGLADAGLGELKR